MSHGQVGPRTQEEISHFGTGSRNFSPGCDFGANSAAFKSPPIHKIFFFPGKEFRGAEPPFTPAASRELQNSRSGFSHQHSARSSSSQNSMDRKERKGKQRRTLSPRGMSTWTGRFGSAESPNPEFCEEIPSTEPWSRDHAADEDFGAGISAEIRKFGLLRRRSQDWSNSLLLCCSWGAATAFSAGKKQHRGEFFPLFERDWSSPTSTKPFSLSSHLAEGDGWGRARQWQGQLCYGTIKKLQRRKDEFNRSCNRGHLTSAACTPQNDGDESLRGLLKCCEREVPKKKPNKQKENQYLEVKEQVKGRHRGTWDSSGVVKSKQQNCQRNGIKLQSFGRWWKDLKMPPRRV